MSWMLEILAPIWDKGSIIRFMGRLRMEASPVRVEGKGWAARIPDIRRMVVPLFPQSSIPEGADNPCIPFPWTRTRFPLFSISMPMRRKQEMVDRQSAPCRK